MVFIFIIGKPPLLGCVLEMLTYVARTAGGFGTLMCLLCQGTEGGAPPCQLPCNA